MNTPIDWNIAKDLRFAYGAELVVEAIIDKIELIVRDRKPDGEKPTVLVWHQPDACCWMASVIGDHGEVLESSLASTELDACLALLRDLEGTG